MCSKKAVPDELELVETEDQITHEVTLEDALDPQASRQMAPCGRKPWLLRTKLTA